MSDFENIFYALEEEKKGAIIVEIPMIQPNPDMQIKAADLLLKAKIDIVEVAIPVRFPWMYGKTILNIQKNARDSNVTWEQSFEALKRIRDRHPDAELMPVGFYGGLNRMGQDKYIKKCKDLGIKTVDIPDYPYIHDNDPRNLVSKLKEKDINFTTIIDTNLAIVDENSKEYIILENIIKKSSGFIFLLAVSGGKTGVKDDLDYCSLEKAKNRIQKIQKRLDLRCPIVAVCGISNPKQVKKIVKELGIHVMFGSAFFKRLIANETDKEILDFLYSMKYAAS